MTSSVMKDSYFDEIGKGKDAVARCYAVTVGLMIMDKHPYCLFAHYTTDPVYRDGDLAVERNREIGLQYTWDAISYKSRPQCGISDSNNQIPKGITWK